MWAHVREATAAAGLNPPQMGLLRDESGRVHLNTTWWTKRECGSPAGDEAPRSCRCPMVAICAGGRDWASPEALLLFELQQPLGRRQFERECLLCGVAGVGN